MIYFQSPLKIILIMQLQSVSSLGFCSSQSQLMKINSSKANKLNPAKIQKHDLKPENAHPGEAQEQLSTYKARSKISSSIVSTQNMPFYQIYLLLFLCSLALTNMRYNYFLLYNSLLRKVPMMLYTVKENEKLLKIKIIDITGKQHLVDVSSRYTGYQLKQFIFQKLCKQLKTKEMKITYEGAELRDNLKISEFNVAVGNMLTFKQEKINLNQVSKIIVHDDVEDQVYFEKYQYQWPCGHYIGQAGIVAHIKAVIASGQCVITCPFQTNGVKCGFEWDYSICKKIGVLTAQEKKDFEVALSENYMKKREKECPKCRQKIVKETDSNRVRCPYPNCKYGDFCFRCGGEWRDPKSNAFCGSQTCKFAHEYLMTAPWDRVFQVKDTVTKKTINVHTPHYRACPNCCLIIQNYEACKHTKCSKCNTRFCWICLSVYKNGWACGSYGDYCGKVAQVQKFNIKQ